ncbi:MAG: hypothetical protein ACYTF8_00440 [Planctomycetota bacterium]|jgi:hypothetical protein
MRFAALLFLAVPAIAQDPVVVETEHYTLHAEGPRAQAEEYARVLEAAWRPCERYFKAKPKLRKGEKLVVRYFETEAAWSVALRADGAPVVMGAGGYYHPVNKTVYVYRQPTVYYSRVLLLHEAAHQFHFLAKTRNKRPVADWYTEGVVEYLSWHHWDGTTLDHAVLPNISLKDYAAAALKEMQAEAFDFGKMVEGNAPASRAVSWALVRWLATGKDGKFLKGFDALRRKMDGGVKPSPTFRKLIGQPQAVQQKLVSWLSQNQEPFGYVFNEWFGLGPGRMRGFFSGGTTICRLKRVTPAFAATLEVPADKKGWRGGVLLHYTSNTDYTVGLLDWGGWVHIKRFRDSGFRTMERGEVTAIEKGTSYRFQLFRRKGKVTMMIGNTGFGPWELPGKAFGLAVERSDLTFRDISWK